MSVTFILFASLILLLASGTPIAYSLCGASLLAVVIGGEIVPMVIVQRLFTGTDSFTLMAIPFFMIAGALMEVGGVSRRLVNLANVFMGGISGGLAIVTIIAAAFFGALTGSSPATVAAIGGIMVPTMMKMGYSEEFALSTSASSGYLGIIIPPSIVLVTYGLATNTSVVTLFIAGFVPGIIIAVALSTTAYVIGKKNGFVNKQHVTIREIFKALLEAIPALLMPIIILGGIYGGVFTPTEAAAVSILYGLFVGLFVYKELKIKDIPKLFIRAGSSSAKVMFILAGAMALGFIMNREMIPVKITNAIMSFSGDSKILFLLFVNILFLIVGTFMEANAAIMIIAPVLLPVMRMLGVNLVHFGVIVTINLGIGMITPPLGMNLVVASSITGSPVSKVLNKYLAWYMLVSIGLLFIMTYWEAPITFLPALIGR